MHIFPTDSEVERAADLLVNKYNVSPQLFDTDFAIHRQGIDMGMVAITDGAKPTHGSSRAKRKVAKQPV